MLSRAIARSGTGSIRSSRSTSKQCRQIGPRSLPLSIHRSAASSSLFPPRGGTPLHLRIAVGTGHAQRFSRLVPIDHRTSLAQNATAPRTAGVLRHRRQPPLPGRRPGTTGLALRRRDRARLSPLPLTLSITHVDFPPMLCAGESAPPVGLADDQLRRPRVLPAPKPTAPSGVLPERPAGGYLMSALSSRRPADVHRAHLLGGYISRRSVRGPSGSGYRASRATLRQRRLGRPAEGFCSKTAVRGGLRRWLTL